MTSRGGLKVDKVAEKEVQDWIEKVTEQPFQGSFQKTLSDGVILCNVANIIKPNSIPYIYLEGRDGDKIRKNVLAFLHFCKDVCRVSDYDLFQPENIIDGTDMISVIQCLQTFGRMAPRVVKEYKGPRMESDVSPIFIATEAEKAKQMVGIFGPSTRDYRSSLKLLVPSIVVAGNEAKEELAAKTPSTTRPTTPTPSSPRREEENIHGNWNRTLRGKLNHVVLTKKRWSGSGSEDVADIVPDEETELIHDQKYDKEAEAEIIKWINTLLEIDLPFDDFAAALKDGVVLCKIADKLIPGSVKIPIKESTIPFRQMENINQFRNALLGIGMKTYDIFSVSDLYESEDAGSVVRTFVNLGKKMKQLLPDYDGPELVWKYGPVAYY